MEIFGAPCGGAGRAGVALGFKKGRWETRGAPLLQGWWHYGCTTIACYGQVAALHLSQCAAVFQHLGLPDILHLTSRRCRHGRTQWYLSSVVCGIVVKL